MRCDISTRGYGFRCTNDAVVRVAYFLAGSGTKSACGLHIAKAVEEVAIAAYCYGDETIRVLPIGGLRGRIREAKRKNG